MNAKLALIEYGLSPRQADIYILLCKRGRSSVTEISRATGIPRVSVYSCLDDLQRQGAVSTIKRNRRMVFQAQAPSTLLGQIQRRSALFEAAIPILNALNTGSLDGFSTRIYEGYDQARQAQLDLYERFAKERIKLVYSSSHPDFAAVFPKFVPIMIERRRQMGIATRLIISESQRGRVPRIWGGSDREIRFIPGRFPFNCTVVVGGTTSLFVITEHSEPRALLIESGPISAMLRAFLSFIWEHVDG